MHKFFSYFWKTLLGSLVFVVVLFAGSMLLELIGLHAPPLPPGANAETASLIFMAGTPLLILPLVLMADGLMGWWSARWIILGLFLWIGYGVNSVVEGYLFTSISAVSTVTGVTYTILSLLLPSLVTAALVASLIRSRGWPPLFHEQLQKAEARHRSWSWIFRLVMGVVLYPAVYWLFGIIIEPLVSDIYASGLYELSAPGTLELMAGQLGRGLLFFGISLPVILMWRRNRVSLMLRLGFSLFLVSGGYAMTTAYWMSWQLRIIHSAEILAGSLVYAVMLSLLFAFPNRRV